MLKVLVDTAPLHNANAIRGIGMYTRLLTAELRERHDVELVKQSRDGKLSLSPDVIHYPFFDLFFDTLPLLKIAPTVVTIHDVIPLRFPDFYSVGLKGKLRFTKQKLALKNVTAIITDSEASKADIATYLGVSASKIHVVYLAAHPDLQHLPEVEVARVRRRYKIPVQYLLYVGDINYNKNIPQLVKAVGLLPKSVHLVCVGKNFRPHSIPEWQWIETQLAASEVERRVHFLTDIESSDLLTMSALYTGALAYVQPSLYEGFGLPVLEAMQCRTPVIAGSNSSLIEVVGEYGTLVEPTAEMLSQAVTTIMDWSVTERLHRTRAAYAWSQQFSWQKTAAETLAIYKQVVKTQS